jgi:hypothetical protein
MVTFLKNKIILTLFCLFFSYSRSSAEIRYVPNEYPTIQAAINASQNGDEVVIANGVYSGPGNYNINFIGRAITVRSQSGDPNLCIVDIQGQYNGLLERGFMFEFGEGPNSVLRDLTIKNGVADAP